MRKPLDPDLGRARRGARVQRYVIYHRVSTADQGRSGLGLAAQERDVALFLEGFAPRPHEVIATFREVQSGADNDRPELDAALALVRRTPGCELLVAKLDRLSRRVAFIAGLMEDRRVRLRVATMPGADPFQLHLFAALAEQERGFVSARTKAALAQAKARGVRLGGLRDATARRNAAVQEQARERDRRIGPMIQALREQGRTLEGIAAQLNTAGVRAPRGGIWHKGTIGRVLRRLEAASAGAESCCPSDTARSR